MSSNVEEKVVDNVLTATDGTAYTDQTAESLGLGLTTEYLMRNSTVPVLVHH